MLISGQDLHLNPTEVLAARSINSFNFALTPSANGFHKILRCSSKSQRDFWQEQIMQRVDEIVKAEETPMPIPISHKPGDDDTDSDDRAPQTFPRPPRGFTLQEQDETLARLRADLDDLRAACKSLYTTKPLCICDAHSLCAFHAEVYNRLDDAAHHLGLAVSLLTYGGPT